MGVVPRDFVFVSYHLGIFLDVQVVGLSPDSNVKKGPPRFLKSVDERSEEIYLEYVERRVGEDKLRVAIDNLKNEAANTVTKDDISRKLNNIDGEKSFFFTPY